MGHTDNGTAMTGPAMHTDTSNTKNAATATAVKVKTETRGWAKPDANNTKPSAAEPTEKSGTAHAWPAPNSATPKKAESGVSAVITPATAPAFPAAKKASNKKKAPWAPSAIIKRETRGTNKLQSSAKPWSQPTTAATMSKNAKMADNDPAFPPAGSKEPTPTAPKTNATKDTLLTDDSAFPPVGSAAKKDATTRPAPAHSLPPTSSWGKSFARSLSPGGETKNRPTPKKGAAFPSLSVASKMPPRPQGHTPQHPKKAGVAAPTEDRPRKKDGNKGSSKKSGANLAAFLVSPGGGAAATTHGNNKGAKKKPPAPAPKNAAKKGKTAHGSHALASHPGMADMHPGMAQMTSLLGVKRSAPSSSATGGHPHQRGGDADAALFNFPGGSRKAGGAIKKGRQRLGPRKKKLTTLKKRVLQERLKMWREQNGTVEDAEAVDGDRSNGKRLKTNAPGIADDDKAAAVTNSSTTLLVENFIQPEEDDLADDDEHDEIVSNLISLAGRVGRVLSVFVPRGGGSGDRHESGGSADAPGAAEDTVPREGGADEAAVPESKHVGLAFVRYASHNDARAAKDILEGMVVGGHKMRTTVLHEEGMVPFNDGAAAVVAAPSAQDDRLWRLAVLRVAEDRGMSMDASSVNVQMKDAGVPSAQQQPSSASATTVTIAFHKILCDDDYEDEEALGESIEDIKGLAQQYGPVEEVRAVTAEGDNRGNVYVSYRNCGAAEKAVQRLNGIVIGGSKVTVNLPGELILHNMLNEDDFEDEDCYAESMEDIRKLALKYGRVGSVRADASGEHKGRVRVSYLDGQETAREAALKLNGMVVGGVEISASVATLDGSPENKEPIVQESNTKTDPPPPLPPMYSGDKIIPERFAACKRVPKIPNPGTPRAYATKIADERAVPTLIAMLSELMRLQQRSKDDKNARSRRRLVMGLREVARGIRAHKVKMVVMANNLDQYGAIDSKLQEILDLARSEGLPVLTELNKRKLGKAMGKSIKVSVVGIQNAEGAQEGFKSLKKMMGVT